jgi:hypothetical protein
VPRWYLIVTIATYPIELTPYCFNLVSRNNLNISVYIKKNHKKFKGNTMQTAIQAPEVFDNLIVARGENRGELLTMAKPAMFENKNAQGVIAEMSYEDIAKRAWAFGRR